MTETNREAEQVKEVYARFGWAVYEAQRIERDIAVLLATRYGPNIHEIPVDTFKEMVDGLFEQTFGGLLKSLEESVRMPKEVQSRLRDALNKRNWLIHNYFWDRVGHFLTDRGRQQMIAELEALAYQFAKLDSRLQQIMRNWARANGITDEMLEAEIAELARRAETEG
jgi:hypothetical protein